MEVGTAIFAVGMTALLVLVADSIVLSRVLRRETTRLIEEGRRHDAEFEAARQEIRNGARPTKNRFTL